MSNAAEIIAALGGDTHTGMCCCPAHDDSTPSLKVSEQHGKALVHCFAGCSQDQVIEKLKERGVWGNNKPSPLRFNDKLEDKMETKLEAYDDFRDAWAILRMAAGAVGSCRDWKPAKKPTDYLKSRHIDIVPEGAMFLTSAAAAKLRDKIVGFKHLPAMIMPIIGNKGLLGASVTYLTRDGTTNATGIDSDKSLRRIYGTKAGGYAQLGTIDPDDPPETLIVAEGIETALSASQLTGHPAIAALGNDFQSVVLPPCKEIIIAADNDNNGLGLEKAEEAAAIWAAAGRAVRIAVPSHHKDWNDCIRAADADLEALRDAIISAKRIEAPKVSDIVHAMGTKQFLDLQFPPREYLLKPWLTTTGLDMIDAPAGHGKTWLGLSIAYAVASGNPLMNWTVERRARVMYVDGELPGELLQKRLQMLGPALPETDFRILSRSQFEMHSALMPDLGIPGGRDYIDAEIERWGTELIILDSVSTLVRSGLDNDVESWRAIQDWSLQHRAKGRAVIYLHHQGRSGKPRGTSSREIVLDIRISLQINEDLSTEEETAFNLVFGKGREIWGADKAPTIAYLSTQSGSVEWRHEALKENNRDRVADLVQQGLKPVDIAKELKLSRARVSQIMKELRLNKLKANAAAKAV